MSRDRTATNCRAPTLGSSPLRPRAAATLALAVTALACHPDRAVESGMSPEPLSPAASVSTANDESWTRLDVDAVVTVEAGAAAGRAATGKRVTQLHAERARGADGRWYTRFTFGPPSLQTATLHPAVHIDPAEIYRSDDRRDIYMVLRDGRRITVESNTAIYAGIDLLAAMPTDMRAAYGAASSPIPNASARARIPHWLDGIVLSQSRREAVVRQLQASAGPPVLDSRGRPVFTKNVGDKSTRIVLDPTSNDVEEFDLSAAGKKVLAVRISHVVANGLAVRSNIEYQLVRHDSSFVTRIALSNHRVTGDSL